jgi:MFS transporter, DHA2 family, multidrug resistance protein
MASSIAGLPEQARDVADSGLSGALAVGQEIGGDQGAALVQSARQAFVDGLGAAAIVGSIVVLCAAIAARLLLPRSGDAFTGAPTTYNQAPTAVDAD